MSKVGLIILDGWGIGKPYDGNAINLANTPNFNKISRMYPGTSLKTSGLDVGLPSGQMGNSEVGHMNLGAGRVVYQQLVLINQAFENKSIYQNKTLLEAFKYAKDNQKKIHLIGLVSDGGVHSNITHLLGLGKMIKETVNIPYYVHAFTDGRDTDPKSGLGHVNNLLYGCAETNGKLATVIGRYYAMDRDKRWERVKLAYDCMVNSLGEKSMNVIETISKKYELNETDEFLKPIICVNQHNEPIAQIESDDVVVCFNFRTDRGREITEALTQTNFTEHNMSKLNLHYVTLTEYDKSFENIQVVFADIDLSNTLGEVLEKHNKTQIRIAETEKYPHVTFFFSGGREEQFLGEKRFLAPSPKVATYDMQPEMSAKEVCSFAVNAMAKEQADFICVNFANPDMVGHTGIVDAEIKAIETVDACLGEIVETALQNGYTLIVTADHGNGEYMINEADGTPNTAHTTNEVPCILVNGKTRIKPGRLADVAPTILALMNIEKPNEMTGLSLLTS